VSPATLDQIVFEYVNKAAAFDFDITNLKIATIEKEALPQYNVAVASNDETMGTVEINGVDETATTVDLNTITTVKAAAKDGYRFTG
ncbi:hypothetical protein, partial [Klebsiella pneumoniae]|uniref:hypothetical protein n=1 Tax=Klebsiella pneumoniae TaxID=573 RepID=UPI003A970921